MGSLKQQLNGSSRAGVIRLGRVFRLDKLVSRGGAKCHLL